MLNKLIKTSTPLVRKFASGAVKQRGSFELNYQIPPRYFMVTFDIDSKVDCAEMLKTAEYEEHR